MVFTEIIMKFGFVRLFVEGNFFNVHLSVIRISATNEPIRLKRDLWMPRCDLFCRHFCNGDS